MQMPANRNAIGDDQPRIHSTNIIHRKCDACVEEELDEEGDEVEEDEIIQRKSAS